MIPWVPIREYIRATILSSAAGIGSTFFENTYRGWSRVVATSSPLYVFSSYHYVKLHSQFSSRFILRALPYLVNTSNLIARSLTPGYGPCRASRPMTRQTRAEVMPRWRSAVMPEGRWLQAHMLTLWLKCLLLQRESTHVMQISMNFHIYLFMSIKSCRL